MAKVYDLLVRARGETKDAERAMKQLQSKVNNAGRSMRQAGTALSIGVTAPVMALARVGIGELNDMQKTNAQTFAALKSTGGAAGVTASQIQKIATNLSEISGIDDQIIQGGENVLLTFNKIGKSDRIFARATTAALDLSVAFGKDMSSSSIMVGKALQDPLKGITALGKAGVSFTAQQKEQIKAMVESGDTAGAQKAILKELETQVGGSAAAYGKTAAGGIGKLKEQFAGLGAELVTNFLPAFTFVTELIKRGMDRFSQLSDSTKKMIGTALILGAALGPVLFVVGSMVSSLSALVPALAAISLPAVGLVAAVVAVGSALVIAYTKSERFRDVVNRSFRAVVATVREVVGSLRETLSQWVSWGTSIWSKWGDDIMTVLRPVMRIVSTIIVDRLKGMRDLVLAVLALIRGDWSEFGSRLADIARRFWSTIKTVFSTSVEIAKSAVKLLLKGIKGLAQDFYDAGLKLGKKVVEAIVSAIKGASGQIAGAAQDIAQDALDKITFDIPGIGKDKKSKSRKGGKGPASGVDPLGNLFGPKVSMAQVMGYVAAASGTPYEIKSDATGKQTVETNEAVVAFLKSRRAASRKLMSRKILKRTNLIKRLAVLRKQYAALLKGKAKAKTDKAKKPYTTAIAQLATVISGVVNDIEDVSVEIIQLGGDIQQDNELLEFPEVDNTATPAGSTSGASGGGDEGTFSSTGGTDPSTTGSTGFGGTPPLVQGTNYQPLLPSSMSGAQAVQDAAMRALTAGTTINVTTGADPEAVARRVAFIMGSSRLRAGGAF